VDTVTEEREEFQLLAHPTAEGDEWRPSRHVLDRVRREKRTFWQHPQPAAAAAAPGLRMVQTVLAAPLLPRGLARLDPTRAIRGASAG
jgi:hypothetical protein